MLNTEKLVGETLIYKSKLGLSKIKYCSEKENDAYTELVNDEKELPENLYCYDSFKLNNGKEYYKFIYLTEYYSQHLEDEYLKYKKAKDINTIKNCLVYFTVLSLSSIIIRILIAFFL